MLVVNDLLLKVGLGMIAGGADLGGLIANVQVTTVEALPNLNALALKYLARLDALGKLKITLFVSLLDVGNKTELGRDLGKALLVGRLGKAGIHVGPLVVLTRGSIAQVGEGVGHLAIVQVLKPELCMLALVARGLGKDVGDLDEALLLCLACIIGVLVGRLRLTGKGGLEVLLRLRISKINSHESAPFRRSS